MDNKDKGLACIGAVVAIMVLLVATVVINGFVLQQLWAWFIVSLGLPSITLAHALGLSVLFSVFSAGRTVKTEGNADWSKAIAFTLAPLLSLAIGWVLYQFM